MRVFEAPGTLSSLMQFIRRNEALPHFLARPEVELAEPLAELQSAIQVADWQRPIFSNPECSLLLLKLLELQRISYSETISVYFFLMALMEFSDQQPLAEEDAKLKWPLKIRCVPLMRGKFLSDEGQDFLTALKEKLQEPFGVTLNQEAITAFMASLSPFEQLAIEIPGNEQTERQLHPKQRAIVANADRLSFVLRSNLPFTGRYAPKYLTPSYSVLTYLLKQFEPKEQSLRMLPCFGQANPATLAALHWQGYHPIALYHPEVKSSMRAADGHAAGPFNIALHDVAHSTWGNWLKKSERDWIFTDFIPEVKKWQQAASKAGKNELDAKLAEALVRAADFDLSPIVQYAHPESRLKHYLIKSLGHIDPDKPRLYPLGLSQQNEYADAGSLVQDWIYLLLLMKKDQSVDPIWRMLAYSIETGEMKRAQHHVTKIETAARNAQSLGLAPKTVLSLSLDDLLRIPRRSQSLFEIQRADSPWPDKYPSLEF